MLRVCLLLSSLLLAEAFVLPLRQGVEPPTLPTALDQSLMRFLMIIMPMTSFALAFKSMKAAIMPDIIMRKLSFVSSMAEMLLNLRSESSMPSMFNVTRDSCFHRLVCEMVTKKRRKNKKFLNFLRREDIQYNVDDEYDDTYDDDDDDAEERIVITLDLSGLLPSLSSTNSPSNQESICAKLFSSCPYDSTEMLQAFKKYISLRREGKTPKDAMKESSSKHSYSSTKIHYIF